MIVSLIVAMDEECGIGKNNQLPWHLPSDLKRFKATTMGHHLIMGRKTYQSIGRPLPGRKMIVISRNPDYIPGPEVMVEHSLKAALQRAQQAEETEVFVIGGGQVFASTLELADRIYLTRVHARTGCDVFFPAFDPLDWRVGETTFFTADNHDQYSYTYSVLERITT